MDDYERLALLSRLYQLHKEAGKEGAVGRLAKGLVRLPQHVLRVVDAGAKGAGQAAYRAAGGGVKGRAIQSLVRTSPYLAAGGVVAAGPASRYMGSKVDEFKARQYATRPYYDPRTQRFN